MVQLHPGSLWSEVFLAACLLGREEGRVQIPDRPHGLLVQWKDAWPATRRSGFNSPAGPLSMFDGR
jgi:hypothetical protein